MKINKITVKNLGAVTDQELQLNGCSVIVTGANNSGKSTILKSLFDRIKGVKNTNILKINEEKGFEEIELTDGSKIVWKLTSKTETFEYITKEGIKQTTSVLTFLQKKLFNDVTSFSIDEFLILSSQKQSNKLGELLGIDLSEIEARYKTAYDNRTEANRELKTVISRQIEKPELIENPEEQIKEYKKKIELIDLENAKLKDEWYKQNSEAKEKYQKENEINKEKTDNIFKLRKELENIQLFSFSDCFDFQKANNKIAALPLPIDIPKFTETAQPEYKSKTELYTQLKSLEEQKEKFILYNSKIENYNKWVEEGKRARAKVEQCEKEVAAILTEKENKIKSVQMPEGFEFTDEGLKYNGFLLNKSNQSTSSLYIAGLKLASINLGELKTVHFEASALDKKSLEEVERFANQIGMQLLIERPDYNGGEITYQLITNN